jgi:hypothetical protein
MNYLMTKRQAVLHIEFHNMSRIDHKEIGNTDTVGIAGTEDIVDTEDIVVEGRIEVVEEHIEVVEEHIEVVVEEHIEVVEGRIEVVEEEHIVVVVEEHIVVHNIETQGTGNTVDNRLLEVLH